MRQKEYISKSAIVSKSSREGLNIPSIIFHDSLEGMLHWGGMEEILMPIPRQFFQKYDSLKSRYEELLKRVDNNSSCIRQEGIDCGLIDSEYLFRVVDAPPCGCIGDYKVCLRHKADFEEKRNAIFVRLINNMNESEEEFKEVAEGVYTLCDDILEWYESEKEKYLNKSK